LKRGGDVMRWLAGLLLAVFGVLLTPTVAAQPGVDATRPRVLVLHSYHHGFTWSDSVSEGIQQVFSAPDSDVELVFEFMDTRRVFSNEYFEELERLLRLKYAERQPDVVICSDDQALQFYLDRGDRLFPGKPAVFCSVSGYEPSMREGRELTGLIEALEIRGTLDVALRLHPNTEQVAVITDLTRTGRALKAKAEAAFRDFESRVKFQYLEDLTVDELEQKVAALPPRTIIFLFIFSRDKAGRVFTHEHNLDRLRRHAEVPIYAVWDFYLGHGIVGGKLTSGLDEGRMAGELAQRVLRGERASEIPLGTSPTVYKFDYRELRRFGVRLRQLPAGSVVVNKPPSLYESHRQLIWGVVAVFVILVTTVLVLGVNIAHRRRAEEALRQSEERFRTLFDESAHGVAVVDSESGRILQANRTLQQLLGHPEAELLGKTLPSLFPQGALAREGSLDSVRNAGRTRSFRDEPARSRDGATLYADVGLTPMVLDGQPRLVAMVSDVTERRRAESALQQTQKLESLGVLAGGIAHDLNNLLTGMLGSAELAQLELDRHHAASEHLDTIRTAAQRTAELCRQLLAYSGKGKFVVEPLDVNALVQGMVHLAEVAISKKVAIRYDLAEHLPAVEGDATQLRQIVMNLIVNGSEAVGDATGTVTVATGAMGCDAEYLRTAYLDADLTPGTYVYVEDSDTGTGMDAETLARLFDPFFTTKFTGRGLGLAAVLGIVRSHHGTIKVYSEPGRGSTFKVLLPASGQTPRPPEAEADERAGQFSGKVLVVDDESVVRKVAASMLTHLGFEVLEAADGKSGVEVFREQAQDIVLVVLDMTMPVMGGAEAYTELRRVRADVRVILMSGYNEQDATNRFAGKGPAGFVQKPLQLSPLARTIRRVLKPASNA